MSYCPDPIPDCAQQMADGSQQMSDGGQQTSESKCCRSARSHMSAFPEVLKAFWFGQVPVMSVDDAPCTLQVSSHHRSMSSPAAIAVILFVPDSFIDPDSTHQQDDKCDKSPKSPGPAHALLYHRQHYNSNKENGGNFVPHS